VDAPTPLADCAPWPSAAAIQCASRRRVSGHGSPRSPPMRQKNTGNFFRDAPAAGPGRLDDLQTRPESASRRVLPRLMVRRTTGVPLLRVSQPAIRASLDRGHSKFPLRIRRVSPAAGCPENTPPGGPNTQWHRPTRQSDPPVPPRQAAPAIDGLVLGKLACQAGFVISFYDLSKTGYRATVQRCTDTSPNRITAARRTAYRQDRWGPARTPPGRGANG
jgi:hypothetical protein